MGSGAVRSGSARAGARSGVQAGGGFEDDFDYGAAALSDNGWSGDLGSVGTGNSLLLSESGGNGNVDIVHGSTTATGTFEFTGVRNREAFYGLKLGFATTGRSFSDPGYRLVWRQQRVGTLELVRHDGVANETLLTLTEDHAGERNTARVERDPETYEFTCYYDGQEVGSVVDDTYTTAEALVLRFDGPDQELDRIIAGAPAPTPTAGGGFGGDGGDGGQDGDGSDGGADDEGANLVGQGGALLDPETVPWVAVGGGVTVGAATAAAHYLGGMNLGSTVSNLLPGGGSGGGGSAGGHGHARHEAHESDAEGESEEDEDEKDAIEIVQEVDPLSAASWASQPVMERVAARYDDVAVEYEPAPVRRFEDPTAAREAWERVAERTGMPVDHSFWDDAPASTEPVNRAFEAAAEQDHGRAYLRALWRHAVGRGAAVDEASLVDLADEVGLDVDDFREDLAAARGATGGQRTALPFTVVEVHDVPVPLTGRVDYGELQGQLAAQGLVEGRPDKLRAYVADRGPVATAEVASVYGNDHETAAARLDALVGVESFEVGDERFWVADG